MDYSAVLVVIVAMFFIIIISIQYTLNKIFVILREIKIILLYKKEKRE